MSIILAALLAGQAVLPEIDRGTIEMQARAEALQANRRPPAARTAPPRQAAAPVRATVRPASRSSTLDLNAITTICRAAGGQADPAGFVNTLSRAYGMSEGETASLRSSCAAYLAGQADGRRTR